MENISSVFRGEEEQMDLPPGFRFHPTDEELISHYLHPKVLDSNFSARAIGEVDLNKCEPWDLPKRAKMGEKEFYFFCMRDRKYPTGLRTNRATEAGYWKATGKDKEITRRKSLVGLKKTLVFYRGRAPKGEKSSWVMHEYRLEGKFSPQNLPTSSRNEWVICRVFEKNSGGQKIPIPGLVMSSEDSFEFNPSGLPPLTDSSPYTSDQNQTKPLGPSSAYVSCFSNPINPQSINQSDRTHQILNNFTSNTPNNNNNNNPYLSRGNYFKNQAQSSHYYSPPMGPVEANSQCYPFGGYMSDQEILRAILNNNNNNGGVVGKAEIKQGMATMKPEKDLGVTVSVSQDTCLSSEMNNADISSVVSNYDLGRGGPFDDPDGPSTSGDPVDIDSLWNY